MSSPTPARWISHFRRDGGLHLPGVGWESLGADSTRCLPAVRGGLSLELRPGRPVRVDVSTRIGAGEREDVRLPPGTPSPIRHTVRAWSSCAAMQRVPHVEIGFDDPAGGRAQPCVAVTVEPTERGYAAMRRIDVDAERVAVATRVLEIASLVTGCPVEPVLGPPLRALVESLPSGAVVHYVAPLSGRGRADDEQPRVRLIVCMPTGGWWEWTQSDAGLPATADVKPLMRRLGMHAPVLSVDLDLGPCGLAARTGLYYAARSFNRCDRELRDHLRVMTEVFPDSGSVMSSVLSWSDRGPDVSGSWCKRRAVTTKLVLENGVPVGAKAYVSLFDWCMGRQPS